jgi:hypothetical protein
VQCTASAIQRASLFRTLEKINTKLPFKIAKNNTNYLKLSPYFFYVDGGQFFYQQIFFYL